MSLQKVSSIKLISNAQNLFPDNIFSSVSITLDYEEERRD